MAINHAQRMVFGKFDTDGNRYCRRIHWQNLCRSQSPPSIQYQIHYLVGYIVAGGNITSIADVELDVNVIVRGNDIIASEGVAIFSVSGIRVAAEGLAPGICVVVLCNQAVKVMVEIT